MRVPAIQNQQQTSFTSVNNPIRNFRIKTSNGIVNVSEFTELDSMLFNRLGELSKFVVDSFIEGSNSPGWKKYTKPKYKEAYQSKVGRFNYVIKNVFEQDDGNSNILVARNKDGNIVGALISFTLREVKGLKDKKTLYIDSLGVDKKYRHNNIAKKLMEKVFIAGKDVYSDSLLTSYNSAVPFYEKIGYKKADLNNPIIKMFHEILRQDRTDMPKYTKLMEIPLKKNDQRWWERLTDKILNHPLNPYL